MRRTYDRERFLALVAEMRAAIPDLAITTDLIVGFPGETEEDFAQTLSLVEETGFDGAFTFVYSPRYSTEAASLPGQVPEEVKRERIERLIELVQATARERNEQRIGRIEQVLVEDPAVPTLRYCVAERAATRPSTSAALQIRASSSTCASRRRPRLRFAAPWFHPRSA